MRGRILTSLAAAALLLTAACAAQPSAGPRRHDDALVPPVARTGPTALGGFAALPGAGLKSADAIVPECVPRSGPPYQIGAVGTFSGGAVTVVDGVKVTGLSGHFCAVATVVPAPPSHPRATVCADLVAPREGLFFDPVKTQVNLIPGVTTIIGNVSIQPSSFSALVCDDGAPGQLVLDTVIQAAAVPRLFGTECSVGPLQAHVTGTFSGPLTSLHATLTSGTFPVSAVQPAEKCPVGLARNTNTILGLPTESRDGLTVDTAAALYLPPAT